MSAGAPRPEPRRDSTWWGWGRTDSRPELSEAARALLARELGELSPTSRAELADVELPAAEVLPDGVVAAAGGGEAIFGDAEDRIRHATGSSYPDLIRLRSGRLDAAADAVIVPADTVAVAALVESCSREHVAVVPYGGGTSVVGGVEPLREGFDRLVSLDLCALREVEVDAVSQTARLGPGLRGPEAEAALNARGFTLGHFPQSFPYATIGGFAATRSAGQASSGYGRFDDLITSIELQSPAGPLSTLATPHTAAGPAIRELISGSEGTLGVITSVTVRVRPLPPVRRYEAWFAPGFAEGTEICRALAQGGASPDVLRLSDRDETRISLEMAGLEGIKKSALEGWLKLRGRERGSMMICGWEGERESVARRRELSVRVLRTGGAIPLGRGAGNSWEHGRYEGPYLRDALIDAGVMVETLETSHTWSRLEELYAVVRDALLAAMESQRHPGVVMCHVSHVYRDGASLYFTFLSGCKAGEEIEQWRAVKTAACDAIVATGGTITHHHAVGRDHASYMPAEVGELGIEALQALKDRLDPNGVMNPGKLIPA